MLQKKYFVRKRLPGLVYSFTENGLELPFPDITNKAFTSCTDEKRLKQLLPYVEKNAAVNAEKFNKIPALIKNHMSKHSFAVAELLKSDSDSPFASGLTTLIMKLGPGLIGKGRKRFWDRQMSKGFGSLLIRMRTRDLSRSLANELIRLTTSSPDRNLA
jgi:hypothetical protein